MAKSAQAQSWLDRAQRVFPGGVLGQYVLAGTLAFVPERASGSKLYDTNGRELIDYTIGGGSVILGHGSSIVTEAIRSQLDRGWQFFSLVNTRAIELAELLVDAIPCAEHVRLTVSGSEAVAGALRIARAATGREKIVKFEGAYHGNHDGQFVSVRRSSDGPELRPVAESLGTPAGAVREIILAPFNELAATREIVTRSASEIAAIVVEPVQRFLPPEEGFLAGLRELCNEIGAVLIFDEIVTGFRLAYDGAQGRYGVIPDLAVFGKAMGGGLPIAAICGPRGLMEIADPTRGGTYAIQTGTLNGNPLGCAVAAAVLRHLAGNPSAFRRLDQLGDMIRSGLDAIFAELGIEARTYGVGALWHVLFGRHRARTFRDTLAADRKKLMAFHGGLIERGVFVIPGSRSYISLAHSDDDVNRTLEIARVVLKDPGFSA